MARDEERLSRSREEPLVGSLPDAPGILTALLLTPELGIHLRGLADELLVNDFAGTTLVRAEREMLATATSAANDCFYCMDSHGAFATALLETTGDTERVPVIDGIKLGSSDGLDAEDAGPAPHRANRPWRAARADGRRCRCRPRRRCHRRGRPTGRPHRRRVLDVQPDRRGVPGQDSTGGRGLSRARIGDRGARLQRPPGHLSSELGVRTGPAEHRCLPGAPRFAHLCDPRDPVTPAHR